MVDPDEQYQKYLMVVLQALSGTDPMNPPDIQALIQDNGMTLKLIVPITPVMTNTELMVHKKVSWMSSKNEQQYTSKRQTRLGGVGPAIAQVLGYSKGQPPSIAWHVPLSERCDAIIGNYSINNFPSSKNQYGQQFFPVLMEFKLSTVEQNVKKEARVNSGLWMDEDDQVSSSNLPTGTPTGGAVQANGGVRYNNF